MEGEAQRRRQLELALEAALEGDGLCLVYQPIMDLRAKQIWGAEALLRWQHPEHGLLEPGRFVPIAEDSGLIVRIDRWVARHVCQQLAIWREAGLPSFPVSINLSSRKCLQAGYPAMLADAISQNGLDPATLVLEVTEEVFHHDPKDDESRWNN